MIFVTYNQVDRSCNEWLIFNEHLHYPHYDQLEGGWARALTKPIPHLGTTDGQGPGQGPLPT